MKLTLGCLCHTAGLSASGLACWVMPWFGLAWLGPFLRLCDTLTMAVEPFWESVTFCQQEPAARPFLARCGVPAPFSGQQPLGFVDLDVLDLGDMEPLVDLCRAG